MSGHRIPWWLTAYVAILGLFLVGPLLIVVATAFGEDSFVRFPPRGFTLHWFAVAFSYDSFVRGMVNSVVLGIAAASLSVAIGVPAALAISRGGRFAAPTEGYLLSPLAFPNIVLGISLLFYFAFIGIGLSPVGLLAAHVLLTVAYIIRSVLASHRATDPSLEEAAAVLGAGAMRRFRRITLPLIRPGIVAGVVFAFLVSFDNVPISIFLTRHDTTTLPVAVLSYMVYSFDPSVAALYTVIMGFVLGAIVLVDRVFGVASMTRIGGPRL